MKEIISQWNDNPNNLADADKQIIVSEVQKIGTAASPILIEALANNYPTLSPVALSEVIESITREIGNQLNAGATLAFINKSDEGIELTAFNITPKQDTSFLLPEIPTDRKWSMDPLLLQRFNLTNEG